MDSDPGRFAGALTKLAKAGDMPRVVVVACEEKLDREEVGDKTLQIARAHGYTERSVFHVERKDFDWSVVLNDAGSMSLFSEKRVLDVRVEKANINKQASDFFRAYAAEPNEDNLLLVRTNYLAKRDKTAKWYQALAPIGLCVHSYMVKDEDMPRWLAGRAKRDGVELSRDATAYLAERLEGNLLAAAQELSRLQLLGKTVIELVDVQESVSSANHYRMWDLLDVAFAGQADKVRRMCRTMEAEGENPLAVLGPLTMRLRQGGGGGRGGFSRGPAAPAKPMHAYIAECSLIDQQAKGALQGDAWQSLERLLLALGGKQTTPSLTASREALAVERALE